jgi:DNA-binding HxlR family transcriptional regulator
MDDAARLPTCSIARAMDVLGERWTLLILRESFYGVKRFSAMQRNLGIARNILSSRLQLLVRTGILERRRYQEDPERFEYKLTKKGLALYPAVVAIMRWGDEHLSEAEGPPIVLRHSCGELADPVLVCAHCREELDPRAVTPEPAALSPAASV